MSLVKTVMQELQLHQMFKTMVSVMLYAGLKTVFHLRVFRAKGLLSFVYELWA